VLSGRRAAQSVLGALTARAPERSAEQHVDADVLAVSTVPAAREPTEARLATEKQSGVVTRGPAERAEPAVRR
jgi:hypothetical protein